MRLRGATGGASMAPSVRCNSGGRATSFQLGCLHRSTTPTWTRTSTAASASVFCSATSPSFKVENWRSYTSEGARKSNRLALEKSPYLLQHQHNPVDWLPYGKEAFEKAKQLDRPLFISIGYLSCHWCHVMERESFEDEKVAQVLNNNFVPVKVDREEMPDVDTIYLRAAMSLRVSCGWPLSVWATPDGHPFHAGTYFPKELFLKVLDQVTKSWQNQRDVLQSLSESVQQLTQQTTSIFDTTNPLPSVSVLKKAIEQAEELFDAEWGGFGRPPKFPMSVRLQFLMRMYLRIPDKRISDMVEKTLQSMAWGGLYDHLGGGFARYSTDRQWLIPHFEKMLYDNALLAQTYVEAFLLTKNPTYASIAKETLHYVLNRMENKELGGFYSAEDADSEGKEGKFYVWTNAQLQSLLTAEEFELVRAVYGVTRDGNFEHGTTHLSLQKNYKWEDKKQPLLRSAHEKLFRARKQRIHPLRDDKQLVSWNALMIKAMAAAAQAFNEEHERDDKKAFLEAAQRAAHFLRDKLYNPETGTLYRRYIDGDVRYQGTLDDYAYLISALLTLYQTDWNASWLKWAIELQRHQDDFFWDKASSSSSSQQQTEQGGYFFTPDNMDESLPLIARTKEFTDGSIPNPNSVSILNLLKLNAFTYRVEYKRKAHHILRLIQPALNAAPAYFSQSLLAIDFALSSGQLAIVLPSSEASEETEEQKAEMISALRRLYLPNVVIAIGREAVANEGTREEEAFVPPLLQGKTALNGRVTAYFCEGYTCKRPVQNGDELTQQLLEHIRAHRF